MKKNGKLIILKVLAVQEKSLQKDFKSQWNKPSVQDTFATHKHVLFDYSMHVHVHAFQPIKTCKCTCTLYHDS